MKHFKPHVKLLSDRVLCFPEKAKTKTAGGIHIPDNAKEKPQVAYVVATGPGKKDDPMTIKVGDKILHGEYSGRKITLDGEEYLIMRQPDIYMVIEHKK